jgi:hypothetical protein
MKNLMFLLILLLAFGLGAVVPGWEFVTTPEDVMHTFYDFMPGGYNCLPLQVTPSGQLYGVFHARAEQTAQRHIYCACIQADGSVSSVERLSASDQWEGYPNLALDPVSSDPIAAWHTTTPEFALTCVAGSYALYHLGQPMNWQTPFEVITPLSPSPHPDDEFIWPNVQIGPSPLADKRRCYVFAANNSLSPTSGNPCENVMIAWMDFDADDLASGFVPQWNYRTIALMDQWHTMNDSVRPMFTPVVGPDGLVALVGYVLFDSGTTETSELGVFLNTNYGEGEFAFVSQDAHFAPTLPVPVTTEEFWFMPYHCHHTNALLVGNRILWPGAMYLKNLTGYHYPYMGFPKLFYYDLDAESFGFIDLYHQGANPADEQVMTPWDLDEDGQVDPNYQTTMPFGWPNFYTLAEDLYLTNSFHIARDASGQKLAMVWQDAAKARQAEMGDSTLVQWLETPEIAIIASADGGASWSDPIFMNAIETPELAGMIPAYIYPAQQIEDLGDGHGKLHLLFLDDAEYGPGITQPGNPEAMLKYASLDINFGDLVAADPTLPVPQASLHNYPNPFNPSTEIIFQISDERQIDHAQIDIFNAKGQKVKELKADMSSRPIRQQPERGEISHSITWDGTDSANQPVASGLYLYRLMVSGTPVAQQKMMLLK